MFLRRRGLSKNSEWALRQHEPAHESLKNHRSKNQKKISHEEKNSAMSEVLIYKIALVVNQTLSIACGS
jgi:hypothetical protein